MVLSRNGQNNHSYRCFLKSSDSFCQPNTFWFGVTSRRWVLSLEVDELEAKAWVETEVGVQGQSQAVEEALAEVPAEERTEAKHWVFQVKGLLLARLGRGPAQALLLNVLWLRPGHPQKRESQGATGELLLQVHLAKQERAAQTLCCCSDSDSVCWHTACQNGTAYILAMRYIALY